MAQALIRNFARPWRAYERSLRRRPVVTQAVTSALLWGAGDLVAQRCENNGKMDFRRALLTAVFGGAVIGPVGHYWYSNLDAFCGWIHGLAKAGSKRVLVSKLLLDNLVFTPFYVAAYLMYATSVINERGHEFRGKLVSEYLPTVAAELAVWPPFMYLVFRHIPVQHQLLTVNLFSLADVAFLSWIRENGHMLERLAEVPLLSGANSALSCLLTAALGEDEYEAAGLVSGSEEVERSIHSSSSSSRFPWGGSGREHKSVA